MFFKWISSKVGRKSNPVQALSSQWKGRRFVRPAVELLESRVLLSSQTEGFVNAAYRELLRRTADPAGLAHWSSAMDQNLLSRSQVVLSIEHSPEYYTSLVDNTYAAHLNRSARPSEMTAWTNFLSQGGTVEQFEASLLGTPEYFALRGGGPTRVFASPVHR
jgi:hypothetical protein